jgi:hypothetical protein
LTTCPIPNFASRLCIASDLLCPLFDSYKRFAAKQKQSLDPSLDLPTDRPIDTVASKEKQ